MEAVDADPRVAAVVITHNRCAEVLRSLGHLARLPEQPHIVLVDNGSTDGAAAAVARHFPQVEVLQAGANLGAAGRTFGVRRVTAPYVALCDDDTWWEPGALRLASDLLDAHPRLAVVTARILIGPEQRQDPVCQALANSPLPRLPDMPGVPLLGFLAGASIVRRSAFLQAGGFGLGLRIGGEEELLAADLAVAGWWLCYIPDLVVHHYPSAQRDAYARRVHLARNALWFAWLRRPLSSAMRRTVLLLHSARRDRAVLRGVGSALLGLPWVLRNRRVVPIEIEGYLRLLDQRM